MTTLPRPCINCGTLTTNGTRCTNCAGLNERRRGTTTQRMGSGWAAISQRVLKRDRYVCQLQLPGCLGQASTADHVIPRSQGGTNTMDNLQAACRPCNSSKGTR